MYKMSKIFLQTLQEKIQILDLFDLYNLNHNSQHHEFQNSEICLDQRTSICKVWYLRPSPVTRFTLHSKVKKLKTNSTRKLQHVLDNINPN